MAPEVLFTAGKGPRTFSGERLDAPLMGHCDGGFRAEDNGDLGIIANCTSLGHALYVAQGVTRPELALGPHGR